MNCQAFLQILIITRLAHSIKVPVIRPNVAKNIVGPDGLLYTLGGGPLETGCWMMNISFGPTKFTNVMIDTGSSDLVLPGINLNNYKSQEPSYNYRNNFQYGSDVASGYGDGSTWTGGFFADIVAFGGIATYALAAIMKHQNPSRPVCDGHSTQGIFGVAFDPLARTSYSPQTVLTALYQHNLIPENLLAMRGCPLTSTSNSFADFGADDRSLTCVNDSTTPIGWVKITSESYYVVNVVAIFVGGSQLVLDGNWQSDFDGGSIVDSCTTLLSLPASIYNSFVSEIIASGALQAAGINDAMITALLYDLNGLYATYFPVNYSALPKISFVLEGFDGGLIELTLSGYNYMQGDGVGYFFFPVSSSTSSSIIFGGTIFQEYYIVFDRTNARVGFGPGCDCGLASMSGKLATVKLNPQYIVASDGERILAHAAVLASGCEYYRNALSGKWRHNDLHIGSGCTENGEDSATAAGEKNYRREDKTEENIQNKQANNRQFIRAVLSHPDADAATVRIVLEYIYGGSAEVPSASLVKVALLADQLLLRSFAEQCLANLVDKQLNPANALELFVLCDRLAFSVAKCKSRALKTIKRDLDASLSLGRVHLANLDSNEIASMLTFPDFSSCDRWTLLIAWTKARQNCSDLALEAGLPAVLVGDNDASTKPFDAKMAFSDVQDLVSIVGLWDSASFSIAYDSIIAPYLSILPPSVASSLQFHYRRVIPFGIAECAPSEILDAASFNLLLEALEPHVMNSTRPPPPPSPSIATNHFSTKDFTNSNMTIDAIGDAPQSPPPATPTISPQQLSNPPSCLLKLSTLSKIPKATLLVRASETQDPDHSFWTRCKDVKNTLLLARIETSGAIIGGFVDSEWACRYNSEMKVKNAFLYHITFENIDSPITATPSYVNSFTFGSVITNPSSFPFTSFTSNKKQKLVFNKFECRNLEQAVASCHSDGPVFGKREMMLVGRRLIVKARGNYLDDDSVFPCLNTRVHMVEDYEVFQLS
ncbi:Beta-secretase 2 [Physocladia obscura]|uniref:Beta-secretase 2 n=1 Tax=Physocladia obscura TaxID=109957 RepID=A0AAD5X9M8_9FUNG|nr:Beta-secretase 2 [Physocladia obscura]